MSQPTVDNSLNATTSKKVKGGSLVYGSSFMMHTPDYTIVQPRQPDFDCTVGAVGFKSSLGTIAHNQRHESALAHLTSMNFTKRRLTAAQIAKLESVRFVKEQKLA